MSWLRLATSLALLCGTMAFRHVYEHGEPVTLRSTLEEIPLRVEDWKTTGGESLDPRTLEVLAPTEYVLREYRRSERDRISLYVAFWASQRRGVQIHSPKHCLPGGGWEPLEADLIRVPVSGGEGRSLEVNRYVLQKGPEMMLVLYWFEAQGEAVADELVAKVRMVQNALLRNRTDGAIVRLMSPVHGGVEATTRRLGRFAAALHPSLESHLPR